MTVILVGDDWICDVVPTNLPLWAVAVGAWAMVAPQKIAVNRKAARILASRAIIASKREIDSVSRDEGYD